jgi:hypothetical protein
MHIGGERLALAKVIFDAVGGTGVSLQDKFSARKFGFAVRKK